VFNQAGGEITTSLTLAPGAEIEWDASDSQYTDAQLATFIHTSRVVDYARGFAPTLPLLSAQMDAYVNINDSCNAFYDGKSINFFRGQGGCGNTGRIADIVYHEFGHALHDNGILPGVGAWDGALSEGLSDFLAATITDDPAMGRGFFGSDKPLRHIDPPDGEHVWPEDIGEIHYTGLIIAGALWDMRKKLVADLGPAEGVAVANHIFYQALRRAVDIPSMYFEALLADDDDGDLTNGTPHACAIIEGFAPHGLRTISAVAGKVAAMPPGLAGYPVSLALLGMHEDCPAGAAATAEVEWRLRAAPEVGGVLSMKLSGPAFVADIPPPPDGSVVQYRIRLAGEGKEELFPDNPADPYYELFVGHVEPLYCTDFESDPFAAGWTHALSGGQASEGADDWQWGAPAGAVEPGDPPFAFSGDNVIGNDLGLDSFNGAYQPNKVNEARSPAIAIAGDFDAVRLHYRRWLNVEDAGFDQANIYASGALVWQNAAGDELHHRDREWRFHDVELSAQAAAGSVELAFELASDGGLNLGGWTLDDVCVVGFVRTECGDGRVTGLEQCDQGALNSDTTPDACRSDCTPARCGDGVADTAEECDDGNEESGDGCSATCAGESGPGDPGGDDGAGVPVVAPSEPPPFGGCGCRAAARTGSSGGLAALALLLGLACARRRSRRVTVCSR
jgi:cysteine-rich repeat protein